MACCMAEKYDGWCENEITQIVDGKEYCIFHAPIEHKWITDEKFETKVFEKIKLQESIHYLYEQGDIDKGELGLNKLFFPEVIFPNIRFSFDNNIPVPFEIQFYKCSFLGKADLSDITYGAKVSFKKCKFNQHALFDGVVFLKEVDFTCCDFSEKDYSTDFTQSRFHKKSTFYGCNFNGVTFFKKCKFLSEVDYAPHEGRPLKFEGNAYFDDAEFHAESSFLRCGFKNKLIFDNAIFKKLFEFTHSKVVKSHSSFRNCLFSGKVNFSNSQFLSATFALSTFEDNVFFDFTCFYKILEIQHSNFDRVVSFSAPNYFGKFQVYSSFFTSWVYINDLFFVGEISFDRTICEKKIIMERVTVTEMSFLSTNIESFQFIDCRWGKRALQHVIYDRCKPDHGITYEYIATIYRRLKKIAKDSADEMLASDWHYMEKEMQRKQANSTLKKSTAGINVLILILVLFFISLIFISTPTIPLLMMFSVALVLTCKLLKLRQQTKDSAPTSVHPDWNSVFFLNIYYLISGYGEKPLRALIWLAIFIFLPAFIPLDLTAYHDPQWLKDTVNYLPLMKATSNTSSISILFNGLGRTLITLQAALFAFALRNKLRR